MLKVIRERVALDLHHSSSLHAPHAEYHFDLTTWMLWENSQFVSLLVSFFFCIFVSPISRPGR